MNDMLEVLRTLKTARNTENVALKNRLISYLIGNIEGEVKKFEISLSEQMELWDYNNKDKESKERS